MYQPKQNSGIGEMVRKYSTGAVAGIAAMMSPGLYDNNSVGIHNLVGTQPVYAADKKNTRVADAAPISKPSGSGVEKVAYQPPNTKAASYMNSIKADVLKGIPGKETTIAYFKQSDGSIIAELSVQNTKGIKRVYGFNVDTNGKPPFEYTLLDVEGNGKFQRFDLGDNRVSDWIKSFVKEG